MGNPTYLYCQLIQPDVPISAVKLAIGGSGTGALQPTQNAQRAMDTRRDGHRCNDIYMCVSVCVRVYGIHDATDTPGRAPLQRSAAAGSSVDRWIDRRATRPDPMRPHDA